MRSRISQEGNSHLRRSSHSSWEARQSSQPYNTRLVEHINNVVLNVLGLRLGGDYNIVASIMATLQTAPKTPLARHTSSLEPDESTVWLEEIPPVTLLTGPVSAFWSASYTDMVSGSSARPAS